MTAQEESEKFRAHNTWRCPKCLAFVTLHGQALKKCDAVNPNTGRADCDGEIDVVRDAVTVVNSKTSWSCRCKGFGKAVVDRQGRARCKCGVDIDIYDFVKAAAEKKDARFDFAKKFDAVLEAIPLLGPFLMKAEIQARREQDAARLLLQRLQRKAR